MTVNQNFILITLATLAVMAVWYALKMRRKHQ